jgi:hypothetical protein
MAGQFETEVEQSERNAPGKVETEARGEGNATTSVEAADRERQGPANGMETLRLVVNRAIAQGYKKIVDTLLSKTCDGNERCAKLLFGLAAAQKDGKGKNRRFPSVARMLAAEPEWQGVLPDAEQERDEDPEAETDRT